MRRSNRSPRAITAFLVLTLVSVLNANLAFAGEVGENNLHTFDETRVAAGPITFRVPGTGLDTGNGVSLCAAGTCLSVPLDATTEDTYYRLTLLVEKTAGSNLSYTDSACPDAGETGAVIEIFGTSSASTVEALLERQVIDPVTSTTTWEKLASVGDYVNPSLGEKSKSPEGSACV